MSLSTVDFLRQALTKYKEKGKYTHAIYVKHEFADRPYLVTVKQEENIHEKIYRLRLIGEVIYAVFNLNLPIGEQLEEQQPWHP